LAVMFIAPFVVTYRKQIMDRTRKYIRDSLIVGWLLLICGLVADLLIPNQYGWFPRAAAMLCLFSLMAEFALQQLDAVAFREDWMKRVNNEKCLDEPMYEPDGFWSGMKKFAHISMVIGTGFWAIGDLLVKRL